MKNTIYTLICLLSILLLASCDTADEKLSEWAIKVKGQSFLEVIENELLLVEDHNVFLINQGSGQKYLIDTIISNGNAIALNVTSRKKPTTKYTHIHQSEMFIFMELFKGASDCQEPLYAYRVEKKSKGARKELFRLGTRNKFYAREFVWINNQLFLIKTSDTSRERVVLEKYTF